MNDHLTRLANLDTRLKTLESLEQIPIAARYIATNVQQITGTAAILNLETKIFDTWDACTVGSGWRFTAPVGGYYFVRAQYRLAASGAWGIGERAYLYVYYNGGLLSHTLCQWTAQATGTLTAYLSGAMSIQLSATNYIEIYAEQDSGSGINIAPAETWVDVFRITP